MSYFKEVTGDGSDFWEQDYLEKSLKVPRCRESDPLFPLRPHFPHCVHSQPCKASLCDIIYATYL